MLRLVNNKELMGTYTNSIWFNLVAWGTAAIVTVLSLLLVWQALHGG